MKDINGTSSEIEPQSFEKMIPRDNQLGRGNTLQDKPPSQNNGSNVPLEQINLNYNSTVILNDILPLQDDFIDKVITSEGSGTVSEGFTSPLVTNPTDETGNLSLTPQPETDRSDNTFPFDSRNWAENAATGREAINSEDVKAGIELIIFTE